MSFPISFPTSQNTARGCRGRKRKAARAPQISELGLGLCSFLLGSEWVPAYRAGTGMVSSPNGGGSGACLQERTASSGVIPWYRHCGFTLEILIRAACQSSPGLLPGWVWGAGQAGFIEPPDLALTHLILGDREPWKVVFMMLFSNIPWCNIWRSEKAVPACFLTDMLLFNRELSCKNYIFLWYFI